MAYRILLIDDASELHPLIEADLHRDGHQFAGAIDGYGGVKAAREIVPDLILLDLNLPDCSGLEVCELLSVQPETAQIPVIMLSASAAPEDRVRGLNQGACDYIAKPFDADELCARVRAVLRYRRVLQMDRRTAMNDGLTGLWNRSYLEDRVATEIAGATRHGRPLSCVMVDIDRFKSINDTYGHATGDSVLQSLADTLRATCRKEDVICRYGGEEFVILCPDTPEPAALRLAERLLNGIASQRISTPGGSISITASIGVSEAITHGIQLITAADTALYAAKRTGRNRVCRAVATAA